MLKRSGLAMLGAAALSVVASHAMAQFPPITDPGKDEAKCQSSTGKALTGEVNGISKCTSKCLKEQRQVSGPYTSCFPPYGGTTATCVNDSVKGPLAKAAGTIAKACTDGPGKDRCPECYGASTCTTGEPFVGDTESLTGAFAHSNIYCSEDFGNDPTSGEAKCEDAVSKHVVKYIGSINTCYDKCMRNALGGKIAANTCIPPNATDPALLDCLDKASYKTASGIDKACFISPAVAPPCYTGGLSPNSGPGWANLILGIANGQVPGILCGSPSGAFLQ